MPTDEKLLIHQDGTIKTVTFNQPHKKNPLTLAMGRALLQALHDAEADGTRVVVLTGAGGNFGTGADLDPAALGDGRGADVTKYLKEEVNPIILKMRAMEMPLIASVRGACVGVSLNLALACDIVYAAPEAKFSQIFTRIALSSDGGGAYFMPALVGYRRAYDLLTSGESIKADEAERIGLITRVVPEAELDATVLARAHKLATGPYLAIQNTKRNLNAALAGGLEAALNAEADNQRRTFYSNDFMEGVAAFLQKRPAKFEGK